MNFDKKLNRADFDSVADLVKWIEATPATDRSGESSRSTGRGFKWDLDCEFEGAVRHGKGERWAEGVDAMIKGTAQASGLRTQAQVPVIGMDVAGFAPDVPTYLAGVPDHMMSVTDLAEANAPKPIVSVCLTGFSCACSSTAMVNRGVAFMSLVDALESDGYRCEVYFAAAPGAASTEVRVRVKSADAHWTPASAAFALAHPGFFRRLWFAAIERFTDCDRHTRAGYGTCHLREQDLYTFSESYQRGDGINTTLEGALRGVQDRARAQGFDVELIADKARR
jgi:hypothetical protein